MNRAARKLERAHPARLATEEQPMTRAKIKDRPDGHINFPVSRRTRLGLHQLKVAMGVKGQAEVVAQLVAIGLALDALR